MYGRTVEAISKQNLVAVPEPSEVLAKLLLDYIKINSNSAKRQKYFLGDCKEDPVHVKQAKQLLGMLLPQKYPLHLALFKSSRVPKNHNIFNHRDDDNVVFLIGHLNLYWKNKEIHLSLSDLLGIFFSIYEQYHPKLSDELRTKLVTQDFWNKSLSGCITAILKEAKPVEWITNTLAMRALSQLSYLTSDTQDSVAQHLFDCLQLHRNLFIITDFQKEIFPTIINLKKFIPVEHRPNVIELLFKFIYKYDYAICSLACDAIVHFKDGLTDEVLIGHIDIVLKKLIDGNDLIQPEQACVILDKLMPLMTADKQKEVVQALLTKLKHSGVRLTKYILIAFGQIQNLVPVEMREEVVSQVVNRIHDGDFEVRSAACDTIGRLNQFISDYQIPVVVNKLYSLMRDYDKKFGSRIAAVLALMRFQPRFSSSMLTDVANQLDKMANEQIEPGLRVACIQALSQCCHFLPTERMIHFISMIDDQSISIDIRTAVIQHLRQFYQPCPDERKPKNIYTQLTTLLLDETQPIIFRLTICEGLCQLPDVIPSDDPAYLSLLLARLNHEDPTTRINTYAILIKLQKLMPNEKSLDIVHHFLQRLNAYGEENNEVRNILFKAIDAYRDHMDINQQMTVMMRMRFFASQENNGQHDAKILFNHIYMAYREVLTENMLMRVKSEDGHYLPREIAAHIMHYAR